ncbi:PH domain-containing protein [Legionella londiniensis]|uniref:Transmembrane protein n=1 Tax=Legionella londiniensis TaxID=45068 RepID=A0A0W0VQX7_9GAMM|nr:PH domain-containing protein [Legionella londiniensis]KTD22529.1 transmembrane protein [Legionella londiniensis]STX92460.1 transmembrane protein [Legionella londiniensis]
MTDNNIVYCARLHWVLFFWPFIFLCVSVYIGLNYPVFYEASLILSLVAVTWLVLVGLTYQFSSLTIKKNQVILRTGILVRQTVDIPISKIESIDIRQSLLGSLFRYGSLVITGTGGTRQMINYIHRPLTCRRYIEQLIHG